MTRNIARLGVIASAIAISNGQILCGDYQDLGIEESCSQKSVVRAIKDAYEASPGCENAHSFNVELKYIAGTSSVSDARAMLEDLCENAFAAVVASLSQTSSDWGVLRDAGINLQDFFEGNGFLNEETGNLHQDPEDFSESQYLYTGSDPRKNDHYPTSNQSYEAGIAIHEFQRDIVETNLLQQPPADMFNSCQHQAAMCCWGRDRQYKDGNGNCSPKNCVNRDPADNSNLCWTQEGNEVTAYPKDEFEGDIHCHGFAWSNTDDVNTAAKWNNLHYVALYDHLYTRGYVESIIDVQDMCGCIEDMNPVSRADCSEARPVADYNININGPGDISIEHESGSVGLEFVACEGIKYGTNQEKENDLSAFAYRLHEEGKMSSNTLMEIYETLVGYENPNNNNNEAACAAAYEEKFTETYPTV